MRVNKLRLTVDKRPRYASAQIAFGNFFYPQTVNGQNNISRLIVRDSLRLLALTRRRMDNYQDSIHDSFLLQLNAKCSQREWLLGTAPISHSPASLVR